jgi:hypothetical protein
MQQANQFALLIKTAQLHSIDSDEFKREFSEFQRKYGFRACDELELASPRWKEDPSYLLSMIRSAIVKEAGQNIKETQENTNNEMLSQEARLKLGGMSKLLVLRCRGFCRLV